MMDDLAEEHYKELEAERARVEIEAYQQFERIHLQAGRIESPVNAQRGPTVPGDASRGPPECLSKYSREVVKNISKKL